MDQLQEVFVDEFQENSLGISEEMSNTGETFEGLPGRNCWRTPETVPVEDL